MFHCVQQVNPDVSIMFWSSRPTFMDVVNYYIWNSIQNDELVKISPIKPPIVKLEAYIQFKDSKNCDVNQTPL